METSVLMFKCHKQESENSLNWLHIETVVIFSGNFCFYENIDIFMSGWLKLLELDCSHRKIILTVLYKNIVYKNYILTILNI